MPPLYVEKRDGRIVPFDQQRIATAIDKAIAAEEGELNSFLAEELAREVAGLLPDEDTVHVEDIQDMVEYVLVAHRYYEYAKRYILYREQRRQLREMRKTMSVDLVDAYLEKLDWRVRENANSPYSLPAMNLYISGTVTANYWLNKIYPREIREAHTSGDFHLHDLGSLSSYCCGWDLFQLLEEGFRGSPIHIACDPPRHFRTALGQAVNFFYTLQGEAAGAQAFSSFDTYLAPFVRADRLTYPEVKQALQEFLFNMNVPTRVGGQLPFTNITLDARVSPALAHEAALVGGKVFGQYGDFQREVDLINRVFCELMLEGDAQGRGFTFPIPTYNITPEFDPADPVARGVFQLAAHFGSPYFANFVSSDMRPEDVRSMCCRLRLDLTELKKKGGGLFGANPLTGSIGVVTINLPRLGYLSRSREEYFQRLGHLVDLAVRSLDIKRELVEALTEKGLYPYSRHYLRYVKQGRGAYWANHFGTAGVVGMNEACLNLLGVGIDHPEGRALALDTLNFIREQLVHYQQKNGLMYNLEATPAEGASYRLALLDKRACPDIVVANEVAVRERDAAPYYTNSTLLPVGHTSDLWAVLAHQDELQQLYTGGTVLHVFLGEQEPDPEACALLVQRIFSRYGLPYLSLTPTYSICPSHGYLFGRHDTCPKCGAACEVYSRVVGYYRPVSAWNEGKQAEFEDRAMFDGAFVVA